MSSGKITQVIGPVVDVEFGSDAKLPEINNALIVYKDVNGLKTKITLEVALELGDGAVRTIAMESTDGLTRGLEVLDTGKAFLLGKLLLVVFLTSLVMLLTVGKNLLLMQNVILSIKKLQHLTNCQLQMKFL